MVASAAKIASNRVNSLKSTGPNTADGKAHSRENSLKHGLCSTVVVHPDDASKLAVGAEDGTRVGQGFEGWLAGQAAVCTVKIERCQAMERSVRSRVVLRASVTWDEDRRLEAIGLASKLSRRPEEVAVKLRESYHGCQWLAARWAMLAYVADSQEGAWTPEQAALAFDLLGTPREFREGHAPGTTIDPDGKLEGPPLGPAAVARLAIDELNKRLEVLGPVDEAARERAEADLSDDDPELRRLRRYEAELHRRMKWALGLFTEEATPPESEPEPAPTPPSKGESEAASEPIPARESAKPATARQPSRAERRLIQADSRREAKRRKLDRLLA